MMRSDEDELKPQHLVSFYFFSLFFLLNQYVIGCIYVVYVVFHIMYAMCNGQVRVIHNSTSFFSSLLLPSYSSVLIVPPPSSLPPFCSSPSFFPLLPLPPFLLSLLPSASYSPFFPFSSFFLILPFCEVAPRVAQADPELPKQLKMSFNYDPPASTSRVLGSWVYITLLSPHCFSMFGDSKLRLYICYM